MQKNDNGSISVMIHRDEWVFSAECEQQMRSLAVITTGDGTCDDASVEVFGLTIPKKLQIMVMDTLPYSLFKSTLIHELSHAYLFSYALDTGGEFDYDDEEVCKIMAAYAEDILEDATKIMAILEQDGFFAEGNENE